MLPATIGGASSIIATEIVVVVRGLDQILSDPIGPHRPLPIFTAIVE